MSPEPLADLFEMGGHALYVWGSFVMVAAAATWEALMLVQRRRRALEDLRDLQRLRLQEAARSTASESLPSPEHAA